MPSAMAPPVVVPPVISAVTRPASLAGARRAPTPLADSPYASVMSSSPARRFTEIVSDRPAVGPRAKLGTAIVLGGSVAGMLAARVLAEHAESVLIIERDIMTEGVGGRHGVPQSSQV